jgi:hypothetical protein
MAIWDNTRERRSESLTGGGSGFGAGTLLYLLCIAITLFFIWPYIRDGLGGGDPMHGPNSYDEYGWKGDPKRFDQNPRGGYSDYYPGSRSGGSDQRGGGRQQRMSLDPNEIDTIDDRPGEHGGRGGDLSANAGGNDVRMPRGGDYGAGYANDGWMDARGNTRGSGNPPTGGGGERRCWDRVAQRDVDLRHCAIEERMRARRGEGRSDAPRDDHAMSPRAGEDGYGASPRRMDRTPETYGSGGGARQHMSLDPNEIDTIDDRRGEGGGRGGDLSRLGPPAQSQPTGGRYTDGRSADRDPPRRAEASHSGYQVRDCTGSWWNPFSEPGCGAWQDAPPPRSGGR